MNTTQELEKLKIENALLTKLLLEQQRPHCPEKPRVLFVTYYWQWLQVKKDELQPSTYFEYHRIYANYVFPYFQPKEKLLCEITPTDIKAYYRHLKSSRGMANNSLIRHHANLYTMFKCAYVEGDIPEMVMDKVQRPKADKKCVFNYYTVDELLELFRLTRFTNIYTAVLLAAVLGLSRSELLALKWDAINFSDGAVTIKRKMTRDKFTHCDTVSSNLKTEARQRTLVLPQFLYDYLLERRKQIALLPSKEHAEFVCVDATGKLPTLNTITNRFRDFLKANGLKKIKFHELRHSCASMLHALGYSLKDIQEWLGHSNIQTTANIYTHISLKDKMRVARGLEEAMSSNFPASRCEVKDVTHAETA